jgi:CubicO group peptidase (beta-lactamase class C family)/D-alanyl-D-alanine dipeptidase
MTLIGRLIGNCWSGRGPWLVLLLALTAACSGETERIEPDARYTGVADSLVAFIEHEMDDKSLPAVSIALVDDQQTVWARGFGYEDAARTRPATAATVYRVGSVSKLFTDLALMQQVERGEVDLDAPVQRYLPEFRPHNQFGDSITLRQLTSHRAGLMREPPVGHYFDPTEPDLEATVASLSGEPLVYPPGSRTKYSNAGIAVVGYVLERTRGTPFADHLTRSVLEPLGMSSSSFEPDPELMDRVPTAYMWTYDHRLFEAPTFPLGMAPAGSMYAPVTDLAAFMSAIFAGGEGVGGRVVEAATIDTMLTPQFGAGGFGIGFALGELDGNRIARHGGAIYGFATELAFLPDDRLGVVVTTTMDGANAVTSRIATYALELMLAAREEAPLPGAERSTPPTEARVAAVTGRYSGEGQAIEIEERGDTLYGWFHRPGKRLRLRALGEELVADGRLAWGPRLRTTSEGLRVGDRVLRAVPAARPDPAPDRYRDVIGEYGWDHNVLYIGEAGGRLHALIEWFYDYPLEEAGPDSAAFPRWGLYDGEWVVFHRDGSGRATAVEAAGIRFDRRAPGPTGAAPFTIEPVRPIDELRSEALAASPPAAEGEADPDLVELSSLDETLRHDIRFASADNLLQTRLYDEPKAMLRRPAAEALVRAHQALEPHGYGLLIHDAYHPWYVTKILHDAVPDEFARFMADPSRGSGHERGAAVDVTLYDLETGEPVEMPSGYFELSPRAHPDYPGTTALARWHRDLLRRSMEDQGFSIDRWKWWHFDYGDWVDDPVLNRALDEL